MRVAGAIAECIFDIHGSNSATLRKAVLWPHGHNSLRTLGCTNRCHAFPISRYGTAAALARKLR
jgi:hypothetical protein